MRRSLGILAGMLLFGAAHLPLFPASREHAGPMFGDEHPFLAPMFTLGGFAAAWFLLPPRYRGGVGAILRIGALAAVALSFISAALFHGTVALAVGASSMVVLSMATGPAFSSPDSDVAVPRAIAVSAIVVAEWLAVTRLRWGGLESATVGLGAALMLAAVAFAWELTARQRRPFVPRAWVR
jgi:hypothetical protein